MAFTFSTENINHALFLIPDLLYLFFAICESITIMRVRWLRTTGGVLSIVFLVLSIVFGIVQLIHLDDHKGYYSNMKNGHDRIDDCKPFTYIRVIVFVIILNIIFYAYWNLKICCRCENNGSSSTYYYDSGDTYVTTSSPSHHHHSHLRSAPHHHSAPHHSAPHRSAPHHSAPHHAPHHSAPHHAPHHSAHHSAHHGGHRRH